MAAKLKLALLFIGIPALLPAACARATPAPSPAPTAPTPPLAPVPEGKALYDQKCAVCHGPDGEGTAAAPAIAGHSAAAIKTQVRNPMGTMMAFPASQMSNHDLEDLAEYIASLAPAKATVQEWEKAAPETIHHWMALVAIKNGDAEDARHHLQDALAFVEEPARKTEMEGALMMMSQGNVHDAEHEIEEMAGSESPSGISTQRFHLLLAQRSNEEESAAEVKHHPGHFAVKATEQEKGIVQEALEMVEKGNFHEPNTNSKS